jgi:serine/threonine-protein kinase RsbW
MFLGIPDAVLQELGSELPFDQAVLDELSTSVIEACTNALEHGNKLDQNVNVRVVFELSGDRFEVTVVDHGKGFDFENIDFSKEPADLMQERGRGIYIMHSFCDELSFSRDNGGFAVHLVKRPHPAGGRAGHQGG